VADAPARLARTQHRQDTELACDDRAVGKHATEPLTEAKKGRSAKSSRRTYVNLRNAIVESIESSRPSRTYSSSNSGESGSGRFSTTCRRHQAELRKGGSQRTWSSGGGGRLVIGRA
jgi:hypothetical protein